MENYINNNINNQFIIKLSSEKTLSSWIGAIETKFHPRQKK